MELQVSYPYAGGDPAEDKRVLVYGIFEGKEQPDDLPKMGQYEIQIQEPAILVQGLLCRYCHIFLWTLFSGRGKFCTLTCTLAFYDPKRRFYNHFCTKFCKFAGSKGARLLMKSRWTFCILTTVISPSEFVFFGRLW